MTVINGNIVTVASAKITGPGLPADGLWMSLTATSAASPYLTFPQNPMSAPMVCADGCPMCNGTSSEYKWDWMSLSGNTVTAPQPPDYAKTQQDTGSIPQYGAYSITLYSLSGAQLATVTTVNVAAIQAVQTAPQAPWQTLGSDVVTNLLSLGGSLDNQASTPMSELGPIPFDWTLSANNPVQPTLMYFEEIQNTGAGDSSGFISDGTLPTGSYSGSTFTGTEAFKNPLPNDLKDRDVRRLVMLGEQVDGEYLLNTYQYGQ
ncbi:hypothetical protein LGM75_26720 [Burkholderia multivorans]|uniref:hypothetical protein n=1 Tax=Burkholderia multivorans TaxID=87883 RepID=UPI001E641890|nr:hypothetical protein [Burkholderia multivorans]MCA8129953.1 hypothetical protein [Burkholderia multivorans]